LLAGTVSGNTNRRKERDVVTHDAIESLEHQLHQIEEERETAITRFEGAIDGINKAIASLKGVQAPEPSRRMVGGEYQAGTRKAQERDLFVLTTLYRQDNGRLNHNQILRRSQGLFNTRGGVWASADRLEKAGLVERINGRPPIAEITDRGRRLVEKANLIEPTPEPEPKAATPEPEPREIEKPQAEAKPKRKQAKRRPPSPFNLAETKREVLRRTSEAGQIARIELVRSMQAATPHYGRWLIDKAISELAKQGTLYRNEIHPRKVLYSIPQGPQHVTINPGNASAEPAFAQFRS
jgi:hypothetical protein